jgi:hypothetical protein
MSFIPIRDESSNCIAKELCIICSDDDSCANLVMFSTYIKNKYHFLNTLCICKAMYHSKCLDIWYKTVYPMHNIKCMMCTKSAISENHIINLFDQIHNQSFQIVDQVFNSIMQIIDPFLLGILYSSVSNQSIFLRIVYVLAFLFGCIVTTVLLIIPYTVFRIFREYLNQSLI